MPWVRGQSGNPLGRPPNKYSIRTILTHIGNQVVDTSAGKMRKAELMWTAVFNEAIKGNIKAAFLIADRLEGKAPQSIDVTTNGKDMTSQVIDIDDSKITQEQLDKLFEVVQNARRQ